MHGKNGGTFANEIGDQEQSYINEIIRTEALKEIYLAIQNLPTNVVKLFP
ncbi:hypothetical protein [Pedobacter sp. HMWF019]|nr:hypothetical protein [Pedobacter sp. HMWF019]